MLITEAIKNANSEHAIYELLTAYLETLQFTSKLPDPLISLPVDGLVDVWTRFECFAAALEASHAADDSSASMIGEAVSIFDAALSRLSVIRGPALPGAQSALGAPL